ncbi:hypothetical protein [Hymenobacter lapidarius]|uniref:hypothetical protein n=1 Tax=Hymenobacter lapidarius TaxID=1908237 RepID=UPI000A95D2A5|nr:hypothetical protein [Hymenobacter lapidarius]
MKYTYFALAACLLAGAPAAAQVTDTTRTATPAAEENFDAFGDANAGTTDYNTQKVLYLTPTKLISVGYEAQLGYNLSTAGPLPASTAPAVETKVNSARGLRLAFNAPVISRTDFIFNVGLTYWNTGLDLANAERSPYFDKLQDGLRTTGINTTIFNPIDNKHFVILQLNLDANGNYRNFQEVQTEAYTFSATGIYGWKPNDNLQWGLGLSRTYRAGQLLYIPVLLYNRTFSPQWGCEVIFPPGRNPPQLRHQRPAEAGLRTGRQHLLPGQNTEPGSVPAPRRVEAPYHLRAPALGFCVGIGPGRPALQLPQRRLPQPGPHRREGKHAGLGAFAVQKHAHQPAVLQYQPELG